MSAHHARYYLCLSALLHGSSHIFTKVLQESLPPSIVTFLRFTIGSLFFLPSLLHSSNLNRLTLIQGIEIGFWLAIAFMLQAFALENTSAAKVAFFSCLSVILVPVFDHIEAHLLSPASAKIPLFTWNRKDTIPPLLALLGVACLEFGGAESPAPSDFLLLMLPFSFATSFYKTGKALDCNSKAANEMGAIQLLTVSFMSFLWSAFSGEISRLKLKLLIEKLSSRKALGMLMYSGVLVTAWTTYIDQRGT